MFGVAEDGSAVVSSVGILLTTIVTTGMLLTHWTMRDRSLEELVELAPWWLTGTLWGLMLFSITTTQGSGDAFIYFQF